MRIQRSQRRAADLGLAYGSVRAALCLALALWVLATGRLLYAAPPTPSGGVQFDPPQLELAGPRARWTLLVDREVSPGQLADVSGEAVFRSSNESVCRVNAWGEVEAVDDGQANVLVEVAGEQRAVPVVVTGAHSQRDWNFENDIEPILARYGCNTAGCHGKAEGQNGFKLSVFGFDPRTDYEALTQQGRGRRVFPAAPERSLLLLKATGGSPHGGGVRFDRDSREYEILADWIAAGLPRGEADDPRVARIELAPRERVLGMHSQQRLRVVATWSDGRQADVTALARFQSNQEGLASVDGTGLVRTAAAPGQVAIMASYQGQVAVFLALIPQTAPLVAEAGPAAPQIAGSPWIDDLVGERLTQLHIARSPLASDAEYLRRVYLDLIGTLPTADEARRFLADARPDKRALLVEELFARPEYADYWALKWSDILRVDRQALGPKGAYEYYQWIHASLAANKPWDQFARELLTAQGPLADAPAGQFYKVVQRPGDLANTLSQALLGVRLACAECHHHPFDRWGQDDYFGMQSFFTQLSRKPTPRGEALIAAGDPVTTHPRSGAAIYAHALGQPMPEANPQGDRRQVLAAWWTSPENPYFARHLANRLWAHFLGRGLVEPVDDVRDTNPPSNPALLAALGDYVIQQRYDAQALIRQIVASRTYQTSSAPNASNERDGQNYSRAPLKRMDAEVLLDAVCQTTGIGERFAGNPAGLRAIQLWDSKVKHDFLRLFGRPNRETPCSCDRNVEPSVAQVLHLLNSTELQAKLDHPRGRLQTLAAHSADDALLVDELYLTFYARHPDAEELRVALDYLARGSADRAAAAQDLAWSLLNSLEFVFNH